MDFFLFAAHCLLKLDDSVRQLGSARYKKKHAPSSSVLPTYEDIAY
jgi:hypothetical protein